MLEQAVEKLSGKEISEFKALIVTFVKIKQKRNCTKQKNMPKAKNQQKNY